MSRSQAQAAAVETECPSLEKIYPNVRQDESEPFSFWVKSSDGRNEYKVQLHLYHFNGWCGCQNFEFACWPELSRGAEPSQRLRCKHIKLAREFYLDKILRDAQQQLQRQQQ